MSDESKTSSLASVDSLADLGALLRQDFQSLLAASSSGWLDGQPLSRADSQDLYALEFETQDPWRIGGDLLVLEAWLTSGFLPVTQVEPFVKEEKVILTDEHRAPSAWPPLSSQPTTARPFPTYSEMTFAENESLAERGPTVLPGQKHSTPALPLATVREEAVAKQGSNQEATASVALHSDSTFENAAADQQGVAATTRQPTVRPYTPPTIRSLKDLASRLRTSSIDEHALNAESMTERSVVAESELLATIAKDTDNTMHAGTTLPQAGDRARATSPTAVPGRTNNFFATTDSVSTMPVTDFANSPAEPIGLGTSRTAESLARLGVATSPDPVSPLPKSQDLSENFSEPPFSSPTTEDRRDSTASLSTGSVQKNFTARLQQNSPAPPFANAGQTVFPLTEDERQRQASPMAPRSTSAATQALVTDQASPEASDPHASATARRALAVSNLADLPEALERSGRFSSPEGLSTEDVDTLLESLERAIEHEYRRYYRD